MVLTDDELLALELHRAMNAPTRSTRGKHIDGLGTKLDTGGAARRGKTPSVSFQSGPQDHGKRKSRGDADDGTTLTSSRRIKKEEVNGEMLVLLLKPAGHDARPLRLEVLRKYSADSPEAACIQCRNATAMLHRGTGIQPRIG